MYVRKEHFIGGSWHAASGDGGIIDVLSPSTEEVAGRVPVAGPGDIDLAVASARSAFESGPWPRLSLAERAGYLRELTAALMARRDEAVELQIDEMGGTRQFIEANVDGIPAFLERMIADAGRVTFRELRDGTVGKVVVTREPAGVVAAVTPWNSPVMVAVTKLFPALLMGCPVVLKPAPESPLSSYVLAEAAAAAGLPPGTLSIVNGGVQAGSYLVGHPGVDHVTFTGSRGGGRAIASTCGDRLRPVTLELGGKSAAIICPGVDMKPYIPALVRQSLWNSGQICISTNRVLVHADDQEAVVALLAEHVAGMKVGDPHDADTDFGPVASARQRDTVERFLAAGKAAGARAVLGGGRPAHLPRGWYIEPTIFTGVASNMEIAQEEIFGPVLSVITYTDQAEAVKIANDSIYGLGGSVYAPDPEEGLRVAAQVVTGTCAVNGGPPSGGGGPFGGRKQSGLGRERDVEGLESFLELKSVSLPAGYEPRAVSV